MNINDAISLIKQSNDNSPKLSIKLLETDKTICINELNSKLYQTITREIYTNNKSIYKIIGNHLITLTDDILNLSEITLNDMLLIALALKLNGSNSNSIKTSTECDNIDCDNIINAEFDVESCSNIEMIHDNKFTLNYADLNVEIILKAPSIKDIIDFNMFVENNKRLILTEKEKTMYDFYSDMVEKNILYIDSILINNEKLDDYSSLSIKDKLGFISNLNHNALSNDILKEFINIINNKITKNVKCSECEVDNTIHLYFTDIFT